MIMLLIIKRDLLVLVLVVLPVIHQEELMKRYPSGFTRTRIQVIGVNFSEIVIKENEILFELAE